MKGKTCIVTGANSGIGKATALALARKRATVVMLCRSKERGTSAQKEIINKSGNGNVHLMIADLASQQSIRNFVKEFSIKFKELHVLVNNAGCIVYKREETVDGIEANFAVSYLQAFLLTDLLLDKLKQSAPSSVVNQVGSAYKKGRIDLDDLQMKRNYSWIRAAANAHMAKAVYSFELARRLQGTGITCNCADPGTVRTPLLKKLPLYIRVIALPVSIFFSSPAKGARTQVYLASSLEAEEVTGKYFRMMKKREVVKTVKDKKLAGQLWAVSEKLCGIRK